VTARDIKTSRKEETMARLTYTTGTPEQMSADFDEALERLRAGPGAPLTHHIGGEAVAQGPVLERRNPARTSDVVSTFHEGDQQLIERAITVAREAQPAWERRGFSERIAILRAGAAEIERRKIDIAAIVTLEVGKPRHESLAEVQESADIIYEYCRLAEEADGYVQQLGSLTDEETNTSVLRSFGVFGVISPFNFPSALLVNMAGAALLAGNTVVAKPSDKATWSGVATLDALAAGGLPEGVCNLVLGGADTGRALVESDVDGMAFTGSVEVGRRIGEAMRSGPYGRPALMEMGGKNPTIVMPSADLDDAAAGIARSAFGLSGQKCSACSRAIVHEDVHDALVDKIASFVAELGVGDPADEQHFIGPVADETAAARFERSASTASRDGNVVVGGDRPVEGGHYVSPTVVTGLPRGHELTVEELFLPFLTVQSVSSLEEALELANEVDHGLTSGIFSRDQAELDHFVERAQAGVLYLNRKAGSTTGAWPGIQSFPGWKASGSSGKGGLGPWFVQQYMREQCHTVVT
jgi:1-pyrroline-5-carboxylate dehydrogenase